MFETAAADSHCAALRDKHLDTQAKRAVPSGQKKQNANIDARRHRNVFRHKMKIRVNK